MEIPIFRNKCFISSSFSFGVHSLPQTYITQIGTLQKGLFSHREDLVYFSNNPDPVNSNFKNSKLYSSVLHFWILEPKSNISKFPLFIIWQSWEILMVCYWSCWRQIGPSRLSMVTGCSRSCIWRMSVHEGHCRGCPGNVPFKNVRSKEGRFISYIWITKGAISTL